jgi:threonine/homoserine/homoserine lactone efflux protein
MSFNGGHLGNTGYCRNLLIASCVANRTRGQDCMEISLLIAFTVVFVLDSVAPGPASATVFAKGATTGFWRTLPFIAGLVIGDLVLFALAVAGLAALAAALGPLFAIIKWIGVAYLLYLAWRMWRAEPVAMSKAAPEGEGFRLLGLGTLFPLGNPRAIGFYVAILPTVMDVSALSATAVLTIAAIIVAVWVGTLAGYAAIADRASRMISTPRAQRLLNRGSAGAMVGAAGAIAARES